ncbi:hypothetical protein F5X97DRAFT_65368 [Nemania serpens]|nr:hypothetical protein F5X97DRAFT_65368 [Nemania serpens]
MPTAIYGGTSINNPISPLPATHLKKKQLANWMYKPKTSTIHKNVPNMPDHISDIPDLDPTAPAPGRSAPLMHAALPTAHGPGSSPTSCDCESETQRIIGNLTRQASHPLALSPLATTERESSSSSCSPLSSTLKTAHALVHHWGNVNGCPNAGSHMDAPMLCSMTDAVGVVLRDHEVAVELLSLWRRCYTMSSHAAASGEKEAVDAVVHRVSIGELELEPLERAIVVQESVKQSIIRLATVLQDIEEEAALATVSQAESPLRDRGVNELSTRLFRLLGTIDQIGPTGNLG